MYVCCVWSGGVKRGELRERERGKFKCLNVNLQLEWKLWRKGNFQTLTYCRSEFITWLLGNLATCWQSSVKIAVELPAVEHGQTDRQTDQQTDRPTDRPTDRLRFLTCSRRFSQYTGKKYQGLYWMIDYGPICGLVLRRTTLPPPKLETVIPSKALTACREPITIWRRVLPNAVSAYTWQHKSLFYSSVH